MKTKRFLSVLLVICALACAAALTATATANATEIRNIFIANIPNLLRGDAVSTEEIVAFGYWEDGDTYNESSLCWDAEKTVIRWTKDGQAATSYTSGDELILEIHLELAADYSFSDELHVDMAGKGTALDFVVNGSSIDIAWEYSEQTAIYTDTDITAPVAAPGEAAGGNGEWVELLRDTDSHFAISGRWLVYDYATGSYIPFSGAFEDGNIYAYELRAKGTDGYRLLYCDALVNQEWIQWREYSDGEFTATVTYNFVQNYVEYIEISNLPEAVIGESASAFEIEVYTGNVIASGAWEFFNDDIQAFEPFSGTFTDGYLYRQVVTMRPVEGFAFEVNRDIPVESETGFHCVWTEDSATEINLIVEYSFRPQVDEIVINGVTDAVIGETSTVEGITIPEDALYTVTDLHWLVYTQYEYENEGETYYDYFYEPFSGVFEDGKRYQLHGYIQLKSGYEFADNTPILVNGEIVNMIWGGTNAAFYATYSFQKTLDEIEITVSESVVGAPIYGEIATGENVTITANWRDSNWNHIPEETEAVFEDGKRYYLYLDILPVYGYEFSEDAVLIINGEEYDQWYHTVADYCSTELEISFIDLIDTITVTGVKDAVIGETASLESITLPENAPYEIAEAYWFCNGEIMEESAVFEDGKRYSLEIRLAPAEGYEFHERTTLTVNGAAINYFIEQNYAGFTLDYSFLDPLEKIEITLTEPVIGATAAPDSIKVPENAYYKLDPDSCAIFDADTMEPFTGIYEEGHKYLFIIYVYSEDGYECKQGKTVVFLNGEETEPFYMASEGILLIEEYSFKTAIDKVELTDVPEAVAGETAKDVELTVPENAPYTATGYWTVYRNYGFEYFDGKFQAGNVYRLSINIVAKEGYDLSDKTAITFNGETYTGIIHSNTFGLSLDVDLSFALDLKVIDKIEITVPSLEVGGNLPSIEDITLSEGAGCVLDYVEWFSSETDDIYNYNIANDIIADGLYYAASFAFIAEDGYVFADNVTLVVNGAPQEFNPLFDNADPDSASFVFFSERVCSHAAGECKHNDAAHWTECTKCGAQLSEEPHVYTNDQDASCNICGHERELADPDPIPVTGDSFAPVVILVMLTSLTAVAVLSKRRFF